MGRRGGLKPDQTESIGIPCRKCKSKVSQTTNDHNNNIRALQQCHQGIVAVFLKYLGSKFMLQKGQSFSALARSGIVARQVSLGGGDLLDILLVSAMLVWVQLSA